MGKTTDFEKEKRKHNRRKKLKQFFVVLLISVLAVVVYAFRVEIAVQGLGVVFSDAVAYVIDNNGFPVAIDSAPKQLAAVGRRAVIVTESSMQAYNAAGNKVVEKRTAGKNIIAVTAGKYLLNYEQGGYELEIRTGDTVLYNHRFTETIYCADIAENGAFAVATGAIGAQAQVTSFDSSYNQQFMWLSNEKIIYSLSLDDRAQFIAVGGVGLVDGEITSAITVFELQTGDQRGNIELENELLLDIMLFENGSVTAVTDKSVKSLASNGKLKGEYLFEGDEIAAFDIAENGVALALGNYDTLREQKIVRLDSVAKPLADCRSANKAESVFVYGNDTLVFIGERVIRFDAKLGRVASTETPEAVAVCPTDKSLYYVTADDINRVAIK